MDREYVLNNCYIGLQIDGSSWTHLFDDRIIHSVRTRWIQLN